MSVVCSKSMYLLQISIFLNFVLVIIFLTFPLKVLASSAFKNVFYNLPHHEKGLMQIFLSTAIMHGKYLRSLPKICI